MSQPTSRRPRTRAPRTRTRKRDRTFKDLPTNDYEDAEVEVEEGRQGRNQDDEGYISIGGIDTTNEGLAKSRKRKRDEEEAEANGTDDKGNGGRKTKTKKEGGTGGDKSQQQQKAQVHNEAYSNLLKTAKNKKRKERRKAAAARAGGGGGNTETGGDVDAAGDGGGEDGDREEEGNAETSKDSGRKDSRFIVFVGNLPYTTTQASLTAHLSAVKPTGVRLATYKPGEKPKGRGYKPKKPSSSEKQEEEQTKEPEQICKGYAFVEFPDAGRMKSCLNLFHHSEFEGRKINVELTAGGGGKSNDRKERVRAKNESLNEERKKRYEEERKKKVERGEKVEEEKVEKEIDDGIHPSRRRRVQR